MVTVFEEFLFEYDRQQAENALRKFGSQEQNQYRQQHPRRTIGLFFFVRILRGGGGGGQRRIGSSRFPTHIAGQFLAAFFRFDQREYQSQTEHGQHDARYNFKDDAVYQEIQMRQQITSSFGYVAQIDHVQSSISSDDSCRRRSNQIRRRAIDCCRYLMSGFVQ